MLTLEEAIKPILEEEAVDGYGPVCAYEGEYHWFVYFGFDGDIAPGVTPYAINKETGEVDFFQLRISFGMKSRPQLSWRWESLKRFRSPRQHQPRHGGAFSCREQQPELSEALKKGGGAFYVNNVTP